jgi:hypothetical protein
MTSFAVGAGDLEEFKKDNESFNTYLKDIAENEYESYISAQLKANKIRLQAVVSKDMELVTKSSELQNTANNLLWEIKEEN